MRHRLRPPNTTVIPRLVRTCALGRGIQYAATSRLHHSRLWNAGSPGQARRRQRVPGRRHAFASSRHVSPEFCLVTPPSKPRGRREGRVLTSHPRSAAQRWCARKPHSSIQVVPITRPSLRSGWTAYAVLSREPSSFWPPSRLQKSPAPRRLTRLPHPQRLDRSDDGQDHTSIFWHSVKHAETNKRL